jgi:6-phosphogluconate dehydrogenase
MAARIGGRSWLVDLIADALARSPDLDIVSGRVSDSGEGRWTVLAAVDEGVPAPVIITSLFERFESDISATSPTRSCQPCAANSAATPKRSTPNMPVRNSWRHIRLVTAS